MGWKYMSLSLSLSSHIHIVSLSHVFSPQPVFCSQVWGGVPWHTQAKTSTHRTFVSVSTLCVHMAAYTQTCTMCTTVTQYHGTTCYIQVLQSRPMKQLCEGIDYCVWRQSSAVTANVTDRRVMKMQKCTWILLYPCVSSLYLIKGPFLLALFAETNSILHKHQGTKASLYFAIHCVRLSHQLKWLYNPEWWALSLHKIWLVESGSQAFFRWDISFICLFMYLFKIWTPCTLNNICVSGCMYHPAELYSGRNTWGSYPAGGPNNRGQWAPENGRPWSHTQRSAAPSYTLTQTSTVLPYIWTLIHLQGLTYHFRGSGLLCVSCTVVRWSLVDSNQDSQ